MSTFAPAIKVILENEGGYVNHPKDPGGATNHGISLRFLLTLEDYNNGELEGDFDGDGDVDIDDIRAMEKEQAIDLYFTQWWERFKYKRIFSQAVATKAMDLSVLCGPGRAHRMLQRGVRAAGGEVLVMDGILGPKTFTAVNTRLGDVLLAAVRSEAAGFFRALVVKNNELATFMEGWMKRAYS